MSGGTHTQKYCEEYPAAEPGFMHVINGLYNLDIIEEESVWAWQRSLPQTDGPHKKILQAVRHDTRTPHRTRTPPHTLAF